jgi:hypothetical protein
VLKQAQLDSAQWASQAEKLANDLKAVKTLQANEIQVKTKALQEENKKLLKQTTTDQKIAKDLQEELEKQKISL